MSAPLESERLPARPDEPAWQEFARAPLVPVALAVSAGLLLDRYGELPLPAAVLLGLGGVAGWAVGSSRGSPAALPMLWLAFAGLAAAYHHTHRHSFRPDDIGEVTAEEPSLVKLRGVLVDEPATRLAARGDPLAPTAPDRDNGTLRAVEVATETGGWRPASGWAVLSVERDSAAGPALGGLHAGDAVEVVGMLSRPRPPANPGERDSASALLDRRIRAEVRVAGSASAVTRLDVGVDPWVTAWAAARGWAAAELTDRLSPRRAAVARALLLGDTAAMDRQEWDVYVRSGVVHILAISGQHLLVLAGFAWFALRIAGVRRGRGAWVVAGLLVGYAILTGLRPSGVRAAIMVAAVCGGLILRRPVLPANAFALAWLAVVALNPTDPFTLGCQLSFVSVFLLIWVAGRWFAPKPLSPLQELVEESRPLWEQAIRRAARAIGVAYGVTLLLVAANAPLILSGVNIVSPVALLVGPPLVLFASAALVAGFLLILLSPLGPVALPAAWVAEAALAVTGWLARQAADLPGGSAYHPAPSSWWLVGFYALLAAVVLLHARWRWHFVAGLVGWVLLGLLAATVRRQPDELRVTFLAVGHGGCTAIETPDGRCLLYDAGTTAGPPAVRRVIAPYLWHRGITRIDELFLSHADTDHFNGIAELLARFPIGRVTLTPTFRDKPTREVFAALAAIDRHGVDVRVVVAGDRFEAGDIRIDVLHPPAQGPPGVENERSLVLAVRHAGQTILLTGDLEKAGTARVLGLPPEPCDVLMAPHHGSRSALPPDLIAWCRPRLVVASRGPERGNTSRPGDAGPNVEVWDTWTRGAVTLRGHSGGLIAEAFRDGERLVVSRGRVAAPVKGGSHRPR